MKDNLYKKMSEIQSKFEKEILSQSNIEYDISDVIAKNCTIIHLEDKIKFLRDHFKLFVDYFRPIIEVEISKLETELKELKK